MLETLQIPGSQARFFFAFGLLLLIGCAAAPVKLECQEYKLRLDHEEMNEDQRRYASEQLKDCESRLDTAEARDSSALENLNNRFTPQD